MHKEQYITSTNRTEKITFWLEECKQIKSHYPFTFNMAKAALLILDMQNYFLEPNSHAFIPASEMIITPIQKLITYFAATQHLIIFSRHIASSDETDIMNHWWRDHIVDSEHRSEISPAFNIDVGKIITKSKYSAFQNTTLDALLQQQKITQLLICGVMTHLCCESTARDAFMRNYETFFLVDGTATYSEQLHLGSLRAISHGFGKCVASEEILNGE